MAMSIQKGPERLVREHRPQFW